MKGKINDVAREVFGKILVSVDIETYDIVYPLTANTRGGGRRWDAANDRAVVNSIHRVVGTRGVRQR